MTGHMRMSPFTALFLGIFGVGAVGIASGTAVVLYAMRILDTRAAEILGLADGTITTTLDRLPDLIESLPKALGDLLNDRRAPEYIAKIDIEVGFIADERGNIVRPVLTVTNRGDEVVSMLAVRVAALNNQGLPIREWTELVATPIAIEDWRGPLFPNKTRYALVQSGWRGFTADRADSFTGVAEVSEIRVWQPSNEEP